MIISVYRRPEDEGEMPNEILVEVPEETDVHALLEKFMPVAPKFDPEKENGYTGYLIAENFAKHLEAVGGRILSPNIFVEILDGHSPMVNIQNGLSEKTWWGGEKYDHPENPYAWSPNTSYRWKKNTDVKYPETGSEESRKIYEQKMDEEIHKNLNQRKFQDFNKNEEDVF